MCLGRRPIPIAIGAEIARCTCYIERRIESRTRTLCATEADAHTPSRRCAPCSLACFHLFFRELPLLTRPRPAQLLLLTTESARNSLFLSPIDDTIAAARPCMFIECASAKNRRVRLVSLCQV